MFILAQNFQTFPVRGDGDALFRASPDAGKRRMKLHTVDRRRQVRNPAGLGYDKENSAFSTSGNGAEEPALPNETTIENEHRNMANSTTPKKRLVASFRNLPSELQEAIKQKYPLGFSEAMMRIDKPNGEFFYAVPFETDEINYLVKIDVKIDDRADDDEDKDYYDDDIKGADDLQDDDNSGDDEDRDDM